MRRVLWLLPILAIVGGMLANYYFSNATSSRVAALGQTDHPALAASDSLLVNLGEIEDLLKSAVSAANKDGLQPVAAKADAFRKNVQALAALPGWDQPAKSVEADFSAYITAANNAAAIMLGIQEGDVGVVAPAMQAAQKKLAEHLAANRRQAQAAFDAGLVASAGNVRSGFIANTAAALLTLLVCLGVARLSVQHIQRQLGGSPEYAKTVVQRVAQGDLGATVELKTADDQSLLYAMKAMQGKLAEAIAGVRSAVTQMGSAAEEISSGNADLSERTSLQASHLERSTGSLALLAATVKQSAATAHEANRLASGAAYVADEGGKAVGAVVDTMKAINASSSRIVDIISVIDGIAFQTNILALNAAVEAARAGDQGRGCAVVASEVRSLAQRSASAAKEIKTLISDSVEKVEAGVSQVESAGSTMGQIVSQVGQMSALIADIAQASSAQSQGFEEINAAIRELEGVTQQNAALVEQAAAATGSLQQLARNVDRSVSVFRLEPGTALAA